MKSNAPIGVLDSGIGGLTVLYEIVKLMPNESTIYLADTANCPYGTKSFEQIVTLTEAAVGLLIDRGVKIIVLACNTMTAAAISYLREKYNYMSFVGMEPAVKPAAALTRSGVIGILATQATLKGELYHRTSERIRQDITIIETAGTGLVELIEQGAENTSECHDLASKYIKPMIAQGADNLVLGCTHYPFLKDTIDKISEGKLNLINPAPAIARRIQSLLQAEGVANNGVQESTHLYLSSGVVGDLDNLRKRSTFAPGEYFVVTELTN